MINPRLNRRRFLQITGLTLGACSLTCVGLSLAGAGTWDSSEIQFVESRFGKENGMDRKVLVAYASETGSTGGIAEAIGKQLASDGTPVDVMPIRNVIELSAYRSFVIGSAVHSGVWMPEAIQFVQDHLEELKSKPTAFFFGCLMATNAKKHGQWIDKFLDPARALVKPVAEGAFAGSYWPEKYPNFQTRFGLWVFTRYIGIAKGDYRDWNAISAWAESIRPLIIV